MSVREVGSYIGYNRVTSTSQDSASGIWSLAAAERRMRAAAWPMPLPVPQTISGLQLWLDASDSSTLYDATTGGSLVAADGTVARWEDKSGNGRHATEASNKPTRKVSAQNGLDVVRGDGTSSRLACAAFSSSLVRSVFVVAVSQETPQSDTFAAIIGQADSALTTDNDCWVLGTTASGTGSQHDRIRVIISDGSAFIDAFVDTAFVTNEPVLYSYINNGTGVFRKDNESAAFSSAGQHQTRTKQLGLFCQHPFDGGNPSTINFWDGDIAEIIMYDSALSDTDREAVENYLMAKWGIT